MTQILHVSCSPRGHAAESYKLSQQIVDLLKQREPFATVLTRMIGQNTIGPVDSDYAISQQSSVDLSQDGSMARSEVLIQELEDSDFLVIGTPVHNFTVPSALKEWIDHIVRVRRTFNLSSEGKIGVLRDRPVFIAVSSGGQFSGARARQPDFLTPYLTLVLGTIGLRNLAFFSVQRTASGSDAVNEGRLKANKALLAHFSRLA